MTAYNIVRFKIKPGKDREFLEAHGPGNAKWPGLKKGVIIKTGDNAYCLIGEWVDGEALAKALPPMIAPLDTFRQVLEPTATGVTDAVSGSVVLTLS